MLVFLIICNQFLGVSEKFWIKVSSTSATFLPFFLRWYVQFWGQAYEQTNATSSYISSFANPAHEIALDGSISSFSVHQPYYHTVSASSVSGPPFGLPRAQDHPFFYIGIYTAITLGAGFVNICSVITQYTGALRASRVLFEGLLTAVVRATMRWHDTTPQGQLTSLSSNILVSPIVYVQDECSTGSVRYVSPFLSCGFISMDIRT